MSNIPDDVKPYVALDDGEHLDGLYEETASLGDEIAPGTDEEGERHVGPQGRLQ